MKGNLLMAVDVLVLPTMPEEDNDPRWLVGGYEQYRRSVAETIGSSVLPVFLGYDLGHPSPAQEEFVRTFEGQIDPQDRYICIKDADGEPTTFLGGEDLDSLVGRIREAEAEQVRIHGTYIGRGLKGAAVQIFSALELNRRLFTSTSVIRRSAEDAGEIAGHNLFDLGFVRYGDVVVYPDDDSWLEKDPETGRLTARAAGRLPIDSQFVDSETGLFFLGDD